MTELKTVKVPVELDVEGGHELESAARAARDLQSAKPGWRSTEFAMTALLVTSITILMALGRLSVDDVMELWPLAVSVGGYAISRGIAKGRGS